MPTADQRIILQLKQGDISVLDEVYRRYRQDFMGWLSSRYTCTKDEAADIYQLTILIFHDNVITGAFEASDSSLKTYLFSIGRNKLLERLRKGAKSEALRDEFLYEHIEIPDYSSPEEQRLLIDLLAQSMEELGDPCKEVLEMYYYNRMSMQEIAEARGYKNEHSAKNQKYKCLKRLRKIFHAALDKTHL